MAISRVPGYSLLANLDRQGTDLSLTSSGLTLQYWDVLNYRIGVNTTTPSQALDVAGNIITSNGHVYTAANISYDLGDVDHWWRIAYVDTIKSNYLEGTLLTNAQPNITSVGILTDLTISGNLNAANFVSNTLTGNIYGTLLTNAQPNITSVGTLDNLTVSGNIDAPTFNGNLYGNVTGTLLTNAQPNITSVGILTELNVSGNVLATDVVATNLTGTLTTAAQPNITSVGTLTTLDVLGNVSANNISLSGVVSAEGVTANTIAANTVTGTILTSYQPNITNLGNVTVETLTILTGAVTFDIVNANELYENNYRVLTNISNIVVTGDVIGSGTYSNVHVELPVTGATAGVYGTTDTNNLVRLTVDSKGRITDISNVALTQLGNISFNDTTISSNSSITIQTFNNGNIILDADGNGIVQISGTDALGIPAGPIEDRPINPEIGYTRFNTTGGALETWDGSTWYTPGVSTMSSEIINPNGTDVTYTLSSNATASGILVSINGTIQQPVTAYDVTGDQITFSEIPLVTDIIEVRRVASGIVAVQSLHYGDTDVTLDFANVNVTGNIIPSANVTYSLGSADRQWKDLWVSSNTIYIGGSAITVVDGQLSVGGNAVGAATSFSNVNVAAYVGTSVSTGGNLSLTGSSSRIVGDFNNGTKTQRTLFQAASAGATSLGVINNGGAYSELMVYSDADCVAGAGAIQAFDDEVRIKTYNYGGPEIPLTLFVGSAPVVGLGTDYSTTLGGNLTFSGTGSRILGDFNNLTSFADRPLFQSNTANSNTNLGVIPSGTADVTRLYLHAGSDPDNASAVLVQSDSTRGAIGTFAYGTGSQVPFKIYSGGAQVIELTTDGNVGIGTDTPTSKLDVVGDITSQGGYFQGIGSKLTQIYDTNALTAILAGNGTYTQSGNWDLAGTQWQNSVLTIYNVATPELDAAIRNLYAGSKITIVDSVSGTSTLTVVGRVYAHGSFWEIPVQESASPDRTSITSLTFPAYTGNISATVNGYSIGYKELPQLTTSNVTLALTDSGKHFYVSSAGTYYYTVPSNANVAFPLGTTIVIVNKTTGNITANTQAGVTMYMAGNTTASNRTITSYGMATLIKTATNEWFINGTGVV